LLQYSKQQQQGQCKPIQHSCRHPQQQQSQQQWAAKGKGPGKPVTGYLYTATNPETENKVVAFDLHKDGSLGRQRVYPTGSNGGSNKAAAGILQGDYDSQGGMQIIGSYLLVVNGGGNTVSTFLMCTDGSLQHVGNVPSGGKRPISITYFPKNGKGKGTKQQWGKGTKLLESGGAEEYWVVVGNQWDNPVILGDPVTGNIQFYPNESYHKDGGHDVIIHDANIALFSFDAGTGKLTPEGVLESYRGTHGGPSDVVFNEDGTKLAVATWGIAHDGTAEQIQKLLYQRPGRLIIYDFAGGKISGKRFFESCGDAGFVGFNWRGDRVLSTVFNAVNQKGLKQFRDTGSRVELEKELTADHESCWTHLPTAESLQQTLYVANFNANTVTQFEIDAEGDVKRQVGNFNRKCKEDNGPTCSPPGDTKEMWTDSAGKNFYVQGTGYSFTIAWYSIQEGGGLTLKEEVKVQDLIGTANYSANLCGIAAFELCPEG